MLEAVQTTVSEADAINAAIAGAECKPIDTERLYREHSKHVMRFVQRYVRRHEDAEDVMQATFIEAIRCADRFSGLSQPSTWLFGIALNLARNHVRRQYNEGWEELDETFLATLIDEKADPAFIIEVRQIAAHVDTLLDKMQTEIRDTFEAVFDGESTYEEAAEELHIPVGTVRSRVSRVRMAIRAECDR
jgi:RNA polymerase sigma-70 factor (ECF subfamily)